jgi:hypothetical protein
VEGLTDIPMPDRVAQAWQAAMATVTREVPGLEVNMLAVPNMQQKPGEPDWILSCYVETGDRFGQQCDHLMAHLVSEPVPPPWVAHAGIAFQTILPIGPEVEVTIPSGGNLQQRAVEGDDAVQEILAVTVVSFDSTILQSFTLPLVEPQHEPLVNGQTGGIIVDTLRLMMTVLHGDD